MPFGQSHYSKKESTATALGSGWVWNILLYGKIGTGYVYCSEFLSEEEAEQEFRQHLGLDAERPQRHGTVLEIIYRTPI
ncbi:tryptophan 7-halogenase [Mastigocladopsis repens]|uniref:tryptophan 7-halogenase n=1 Tax=Mastigocladopsis repens TaxID=221287 RepID=UPI000303140E|nr:tryptophan 7-halogenase [Mastigocladopsis repens]